MAEFTLMHCFVDYVHKENMKRSEGTTSSDEVRRNINPNLELVGQEEAIDAFTKMTGLSRSRAMTILKSAKHHRFINDGHLLLAGSDRRRLSVTYKEGLSFIQTRWCVRTGLWREIFRENSKLITITTTLVIAFCTILNLWITVSASR